MTTLLLYFALLTSTHTDCGMVYVCDSSGKCEFVYIPCRES